MQNVGENAAPLVLHQAVYMVTIEVLRIKQCQKIVMAKRKPLGFCLQSLVV
jgi:hypothetical protein